ncbi:MAG: type III pantothenate kinase [Chitinophagales bacterium]|nr:type III pantothenate kinase [Chitinophagales bacterium]
MKVGIFHPEKEDEFLHFEKYELNTFIELQNQYPQNRIIVSSTARLNIEIENYLKSQKGFLAVSSELKFPFHNLYFTPQTLGADRYALAAAASMLYPATNCLIIDAGTCITLDFVNQDGEYLGGSIHPGIKMRLLALHNYTGKLPLVEKKWTDKLVGQSTIECIQTGTIAGTIKEIDGFIDDYRKKYSDLVVLLTGGDTDLFFYKLKNEIFANPNLVLIGLQKIAIYNA